MCELRRMRESTVFMPLRGLYTSHSEWLTLGADRMITLIVADYLGFLTR